MMIFPDGLLYTKEHIWLKQTEEDGSPCIICGITDRAQDLLGEVTSVDLPQQGKTIRKDQTLASLESLKSVYDVQSPVSGVIISVNTGLEDSPSLLNSSPYYDGWIARISLSDKNELAGYMTKDEYSNSIE